MEPDRGQEVRRILGHDERNPSQQLDMALAEDPGVDRLAELARGHAIDSADHGSTRLPRVSAPVMFRQVVPYPGYPPIPARSKGGIAGRLVSAPDRPSSSGI